MSWFNRNPRTKTKTKHLPHHRLSKMSEKYFEDIKIQVKENNRSKTDNKESK